MVPVMNQSDSISATEFQSQNSTDTNPDAYKFLSNIRIKMFVDLDFSCEFTSKKSFPCVQKLEAISSNFKQVGNTEMPPLRVKIDGRNAFHKVLSISQNTSETIKSAQIQVCSYNKWSNIPNPAHAKKSVYSHFVLF